MNKVYLLLLSTVCLCLINPVWAGIAGISTTNQYVTVGDGGETDQLTLMGTGTGQEDSLINVIKAAVNWILGILALIALLILLWGGFQMVTSAGNDEQYKKGFTILQHAAAGLLLIGVAWFIVSIVFWLANQITTNPGIAGSQS